MLCNAGESKSIFVDDQNPCLQAPQVQTQLRSIVIATNPRLYEATLEEFFRFVPGLQGT